MTHRPRPRETTLRPRRAGAAIIAGLVVLVSLSGCLRLDMDVAISGDTVDGTMIVAFDRRLLSLTGQTEQDLLAGFARDTNLPDGHGVRVEEYADDIYVGRRLILTGVSLAEFAGGGADPDELSIVHDSVAGVYRVHGVMDLTAVDGVPAEVAPMISSLRIHISITFPGPVLRHNGELAGTTVTWQPRAGERTMIQAEANDESSLSWSVVAAVLVGLAGVLAAIAILGVRVLRGRDSAAPAVNPAADPTRW